MSGEKEQMASSLGSVGVWQQITVGNLHLGYKT